MRTVAAPEFHCAFAASERELREKGQELARRFLRFVDREPIIDLGCGDGAFLAYLSRAGWNQLLGVDANEAMCQIAASTGVPVERSDILSFVRRKAMVPALYLYLDVIEHLEFATNEEILASLPTGSRLIIQTPNTRSILGHQMYLEVPSHLAPYSPNTIKQFLGRLHFRIVEDGTVVGPVCAGWRRRFSELLIRRFLGLDPGILLGGGNYYLVADR